MEEEQPQSSATQKSSGTMVYRIVYFILGIIEILLAIRFALIFFGANVNAGFSQIIGSLTDPLMAPFSGIFPIREGEFFTVSVSIILAMAVYALIFWGIVKLIKLVRKD